MKTARRPWLAMLAAPLLLVGATSQHAAAQDTIKVGILHSLSGTMAISETILKDLMLMQIADQNAKGGLLGKKIEPVVVDPASNWPLFAEKARELISRDKVAAVFGCWTSVSRKSVLPVFSSTASCSIRSNTRARKRLTTSSMAAPCPTTRRSPRPNI
jgi:urea transport system substrate-binding protein